VAQLMVGYKADSKGPEIIGDSNLMAVSVRFSATAVVGASKTVRYDPRYLSIRILVSNPLEGPSGTSVHQRGVSGPWRMGNGSGHDSLQESRPSDGDGQRVSDVALHRKQLEAGEVHPEFSR
jgi:hypothetical protein